MADDLLNVLTRFHREVVLPDFERVLDSRLDTSTGSLRNMLLANLDAVCMRLDRLETGFQSLHAGIRRINERLAAIEQRLDMVTGESLRAV